MKAAIASTAKCTSFIRAREFIFRSLFPVLLIYTIDFVGHIYLYSCLFSFRSLDGQVQRPGEDSSQSQRRGSLLDPVDNEIECK